jgi:uncharacterized protein (UPF0333 family)
MNKRGQAALEFLMTYGWAILVVLVVIGALAYFGVLNPTMFVPERCTLSAGQNCIAAVVNGTSASLLLENGMGQAIVVTGLNVSYTTGERTYYCDTNSSWAIVSLNNGQSKDIKTNACGTNLNFTSLQGRKLKFDVVVDYYLEQAGSAYTTKSSGQIVTTVQ